MPFTRPLLGGIVHTVKSRAHRPTIVGAVLALFFSLVFIAAPAQAATLTFSSDKTTIELGESFTLSWNATETTQVEATGAWSGDKPETGTQDITPTSTGSFTYTLIAHDENGRDVTHDVTVEVTPVAPTEVTPLPVTFPDDCTVVVPTTEGVIYYVTLDGDTEIIGAGTYDGTDFDADSAAVFTASADEGFVIADGATVTWNYTPADECFGDIGNDEVVTTKASCSAVTFTNITDGPVTVAYGSFDNQNEDGDVTIAAGASKKVTTSRSSLDFAAFGGEGDSEEGLFQIGSVKVPQNCGSNVSDPKPTKAWKVKHPTTAPAAGVTGDDNGPVAPFMVLLGIATLIAVRRAYSLGR